MRRFLNFFFLGIAITSLGLLALPFASDAQVDQYMATRCGASEWKAVDICLSIPILGAYRVKDAVQYINIFYQYFLPILAMLAVLIIMFAGVRWMASSGNTKVIESSKQMISGAIIGLILALTTIVILRFINVSLVELNTIRPRAVTADFTGNEVYCQQQHTNKVKDINGVEREEPAVCGNKFVENVGGKKVDCVVDECPGDKHCLPVKEGGAWECSDYKTVCEATDKNKCSATDEIIHTLDPLGTTEEGCTKDEQPGSDSCKWGSILICDNYGNLFKSEDSNYKEDPARVSCLAATKESPCEGDNEGQFEDCETGWGKTSCTDNKPIKGANCICCMKVSDIDCRPYDKNQTLKGCNPNEVPVPKEKCEGADARCQDDQKFVCCAELIKKY